MSTTACASTNLLTALADRKSIYALSASSPIPDARIIEVVKHCLKHAPTAFNVQSARVILLLKEEHTKLWDLAATVYEPVIGPEKWPFFKGKIEEYRAAYGTVLVYEDPTALQTTETMLGPTRWPLVAARMPSWCEHASGMLQYALWLALDAEGLGCNLQHYDPLIDTRVGEEFGAGVEWSLKAQLVFGKPEGGRRVERTYDEIEEARFWVRGA